MEKMVSSYGKVHNQRYWDELHTVIPRNTLQGKKIMDLGCGPGLLLKDLIEYYQPQEVIGIDLSDIMLDRARKELDKYSDQVQIELINQHLQDNPILPEKVDAIFTSRVIRSFEEQFDIMTSIFNSLEVSGYFVILDWAKSTIQTYEEWFKSVDHDFDNLTKAEIIKYHRNFSRYDLEDWRYILEAVGFQILHQYQLNPVHLVTIAKKP